MHIFYVELKSGNAELSFGIQDDRASDGSDTPDNRRIFECGNIAETENRPPNHRNAHLQYLLEIEKQ